MTRTLRFPEPAAWLLPWAFVWALVPSVRAAAPVRLENGVSVASEPSDAPLEVVVTLPAGRRSDPPGKAGLAELTARCLTGSSGAGRPEGDLVALLARTVGGADLGVSDDGITIHLSDVHDLGPALRLVVELVARPELAPAAVLAARSGMAIEAEDALQHDLRASEARARLVGGPSPWEATWELLQLEQEDVAEFHALRYAPGEALVVIAGKGAPAAGAAAETLPEDVRTALEAWPPKPSRSSPDADAAGRVASRAVRNDEPTWILGESSGAAFAHVVVRHAAAALRTAFALDPRNAWELREAPGEQGGRVLVADSRAANPSRAVRDLRRALQRVASGAAAPQDAADLRGAASGALELAWRWDGAKLASPPAAASATDVRAAAAELLASPMTWTAEVAATGTSAASRGRSLPPPGPFAHATVHGWNEPPDAGGRSAARAAQRALVGVAQAYRVRGLRGVASATTVSDESVTLEGQPKPMGVMRIDLDPRAMTLRQEIRYAAAIQGSRVLTMEGAEIRKVESANPDPLDRTEAAALRTLFFHHPLPLLLRATGGTLPARARAPEDGGRTLVVEIADSEGGVTTLRVDAASHRIAAVTYRNRIRAEFAPRDVVTRWSDERDVDGVLLPFREETVPGASPMTSVSQYRSWRLHPAGLDPLKVSTSPDDIETDAPNDLVPAK